MKPEKQVVTGSILTKLGKNEIGHRKDLDFEEENT
jgi:hypothetical protein